MAQRENPPHQFVLPPVQQSSSTDMPVENALRSAQAATQQASAQEILCSGVSSSVIPQTYFSSEALPDIQALMGEVDRISSEISDSDNQRMPHAERMLVAQSIALQAMFVDLACRAKSSDSREWIETLTRLALRAQTNCTQTLRTLSEMRAPQQVAFVRQSNVSHGPMQVNNQSALTSGRDTRARKKSVARNELLEKDSNGHELDTGTQSTPGTHDSSLAPLGEINRPDVIRRESCLKSKRR